MHFAEQRPDEPRKEALLASAHSASKRLEASAAEPFEQSACVFNQ
jgi:hypothetical protein